MIDAVGKTGQVHFDGQYVTITRNGFRARSIIGKGEKRLHIAQIAAVQWKPAAFAVNGFIQFTFPGARELKGSMRRQGNAAIRDENCVVFSRAQQPSFERLREALDDAMARQHAAPHAVPAQVPLSVADELAKLGALVQQGIISPQDFEAAKARLLGY
ncbi:hypothetical protein P3T37_003811 [Kitasatospora sp. MAA4]|uniref:DUF4429 domain-containing protein n=1 Tax=Kitasatospora sp. MAA4 TaxID=3035093 RepID=UPI002475E7B6|nr:DUF4429 domain-containing protein [Kitasatospora sp. MAA4]MDH6134408.1 hypothetical protein [Kitasatospora sp. MAA4]